MNMEIFFRIAAIVLFIIGALISAYYRRRADRETGERISPRAEGLPIMITLRVVGLALWLAIFAYMLNPAWLAWSQLPLPAWARSLGILLGLLADGLSYWVFSSLGNNVSPSVQTRSSHQLVTYGPYRWVRHPLYAMGMLAYLGFALLASSWIIALLAIAVFITLLVRLPQEEAYLILKFGDEYRNHMKRTGRFLPRLGAGS